MTTQGEQRCRTCRGWEREGDWRHAGASGWKTRSCKMIECGRREQTVFVCTGEGDYDIQVGPEFGCVLWEAAE
jgi:hypothetical protein